MMPAEKQAGEIEVEVTGAQFQWYFRYPGADGVFGRTDAQKFAKPDEGNPLGIDPSDPAGRDDILSTAMVVPVGHGVHLHLRAQDVIHSLFIPAMRFKQDTVPGMEIHSHFTPTKIGNYEIACAELCGIGHYRMRAMVRVVSGAGICKRMDASAQRDRLPATGNISVRQLPSRSRQKLSPTNRFLRSHVFSTRS